MPYRTSTDNAMCNFTIKLEPNEEAIFNHAFLWFIKGNLNLSDIAKNAIEDQNNQKFLSVASLWEMSIKMSLGKLELAPATRLWAVLADLA